VREISLVCCVVDCARSLKPGGQRRSGKRPMRRLGTAILQRKGAALSGMVVGQKWSVPAPANRHNTAIVQHRSSRWLVARYLTFI